MWDKNVEQKHGTTTSKWGGQAPRCDFFKKKTVKSETSRCLFVWRGRGSEDKFRNQALRRCLEDFGMNSVAFFG